MSSKNDTKTSEVIFLKESKIISNVLNLCNISISDKNLIAIVPLCLMAGITVYFTYNFNWTLRSSQCIILSILILHLYGYFNHINVIFAATTICIFGFCCANLQFPHYHNKITKGNKSYKNANIRGEIIDILYSTKPSAIMKDVVINKNTKIDGRVKLQFSHSNASEIYNLEHGSYIDFTGDIYNVSQPIYPRSDLIDLNHAKNITMRSVARSGVNIIPAEVSIRSIIDNIRSHITKRIANIDPNSAGYGIVIALTVGGTGYISLKDLHNIRKSGFAHLLAISGLHIGIVAGATFYILRFIAVRIQFISLYHDVKKITALLTILITFCYVILTNMSVSVTRSAIMFFLLMICIIRDSKPEPIRIWSITAIAIIVMFPDKIFTPSFQMSLMATLSLMAFYQATKDRYITYKNNKRGILSYIFAIFTSSTIATFATAIFEIYHFHQYSLIGLISNIVAIPLVEFILLPICIIGLLLMPLNIDEIVFLVANKIGNLVLLIAEFFANSELWYFIVRQMPAKSLIFDMIGLTLIFSLWKTVKMRMLGFACIIFGTCIHYYAPHADIIVSKSGNIMAFRNEVNGKYFSTSAINHGSALYRSWTQNLGQNDLVVYEASKMPQLACDKQDPRISNYCTYYTKNGVAYIMLKTYSKDKDKAKDVHCANYSFIINLTKMATPCPKTPNLNLRKLKRSGTQVVIM